VITRLRRSDRKGRRRRVISVAVAVSVIIYLGSDAERWRIAIDLVASFF